MILWTKHALSQMTFLALLFDRALQPLLTHHKCIPSSNPCRCVAGHQLLQEYPCKLARVLMRKDMFLSELVGNTPLLFLNLETI